MRTKTMAQCALFAALLTIGAWIRIPTPFGVPFTLQLFVSMLIALTASPAAALCSHASYMALGLMGVPVFSSGGGIHYIFTASFGYLLGSAVGAAIGSAAYMRGRGRVMDAAVCCAVVMFSCYAFGLAHLALVTGALNSESFAGLLVSGAAVFLPLDAIKAAGAILTARKLRKAQRGACPRD